MKTDSLPILFKKDKEDGRTIVVFPTIQGTRDRWTVQILTEREEHSTATTDYVRSLKPQTDPTEIERISKILKNYYQYDFYSVKRWHHSYDSKRA
jgi:hypothetical protein